jgi:hypothetical protein
LDIYFKIHIAKILSNCCKSKICRLKYSYTATNWDTGTLLFWQTGKTFLKPYKIAKIILVDFFYYTISSHYWNETQNKIHRLRIFYCMNSEKIYTFIGNPHIEHFFCHATANFCHFFLHTKRFLWLHKILIFVITDLFYLIWIFA